MQVKRYRSTDREAWERFISTSNNGTIFHRQQFLEYHPPDRFQSHHLMFFEGEALVSVFPAAIREVKGQVTLISHPGASYGGLVCIPKAGIQDVDHLVTTLLSYARKKGFHSIRMTLPPRIYLQQPNDNLDFCLFRHGFRYVKRDVSSVITMRCPPEAVLGSFKSEARTAVRKGIRSGIIVRQSRDLAGFYGILKTNLKMRHNVNPTHTLEELERLKGLMSNDIRLFGAFLEDRMIAGIMIFICNPRALLAFYISHSEEFQSYRPVNLVMYEVIQWALAHHFSYYDLGIFTVDMEPNWGLGRFKESLGAQGVFRDTLYINLP